MKRIPYLQQGDVLIFLNQKIPKDAKHMKSAVLQEGEHTGHAHRLQFRHDDIPVGLGVYQHPTSLEKFFSLKEETQLSHEEHKAFAVPAGDHAVRIVREYDHFQEEARNVMD